MVKIRLGILTLLFAIAIGSAQSAPRLENCKGGALGEPWKGVQVYSNAPYQGKQTSCGGDSDEDRGLYGYAHQCVEFVRRFYATNVGIHRGNENDSWPRAMAADMFSYPTAIGMKRFSNGQSTTRPQPDDIVVFGRASANDAGHVAIVVVATDNSIELIEQNWSSTGRATLSAKIQDDGTYYISPRGPYAVLGWMGMRDESNCEEVFFADTFNRPDGPVGNGWQNTTGNIGGDLEIRDGVLTTPTADGSAGIFRSIEPGKSVSISANVTELNGFGERLRRHDVAFLVGSNGALNSGYGIRIQRGDQDYSDSRVHLELDGNPLAFTMSSFQFGAKLAVSVLVNPDGSVSGTIKGDGNTFAFDFEARPVSLPGINFAIYQGFPDGRSATITHPTINDLSVTYGCGGS